MMHIATFLIKLCNILQARIQYADMLSVFLDVSIMEGSGTAQHETEILFRNVEAKPESKAGMMS